MTEDKVPTNKFEALRQQAEELIRNQTHTTPETPPDILDLIHELKIYQAELEIQNEELQLSQQEISELKQEYQNLYEFAPCGYLTLNNKGIITRLNLTGSRLLETERNHMSRVGFSQFIDLGWEDAYFSARAESSKTGQKQSIELPIKRTNNLPVWVRADIEADCNTTGAVIQWRVVLLDITERKKFEADLRESEVLKNSIIESSLDCIKLLDLKGNLKYMSKAGQKRLEIKDIEVYLDKNWVDFWQGKDKINAQTAVDAAAKGAVGTFQAYSPTETGKPRWWDVIITPINNAAGEVERLLAVSRDITEKKRIEDQLNQSKKMESIGNLAGGIAHDFNNILSSVIGFTELALDEAEKGTLIEDSLQEVYEGGKRAKELVKQILAFARQSDEKISPIQPRVLVREVLNFIRSTIPTTIEIRENIKSESVILGNATQVHQVLMNLCTNAAYAMEDSGGTLNISLKDVFIDKEKLSIDMKPGDYVEIKVVDTGTGIPPDKIDSIFEPYFTTKPQGEGTGIGLAMVQGVVESYGGKIAVKSQMGKGTTFTIYLPITKKRSGQSAYLTEELPTGTERILFVDDEAPIAKMGSQILEHLGYSVTTRTSSIEALELFQTKPDDFDLVVTDVTMPNMTGDKLAVKLMKIRPEIPVILCTGYSKKMSDEKALEIGIKAFAYKPVVKSDLVKTVRKVLDDAKGSTQS